MNNNRGNNRRRGRGNNRQGGGGQQVNRIDSRARGNAPQLLEKYRKLAHDAHLNGDRVQEEYYLQFADHYFRVLADARLRQEEQQQQRGPRPDRWQDNGGEGSWREDGDDAPEAGADNEFVGEEQASPPPRRDRQERFERGERGERPERQPRREREERDAERQADEPGAEAPAQDNPYEPADNPFLRESRGTRGLKPRREDRRPRRSEEGAPARDDDSGQLALDPAMLPPAISAPREEAATEEAPVKRPRGRPRKKPAGEDGEPVESVG